MKMELDIDEELLKKAMRESGIKDAAAVIHKGLEELIYKAAAERLISLGSKMPKAAAAARNRLKT